MSQPAMHDLSLHSKVLGFNKPDLPLLSLASKVPLHLQGFFVHTLSIDNCEHKLLDPKIFNIDREFNFLKKTRANFHFFFYKSLIFGYNPFVKFVISYRCILKSEY